MRERDRSEADGGRRQVLRVLGSLAGAGLLGCGGDAATTPTTSVSGCVVRPEQTEGPYFVDEALNRSDIRTDPATGAVRPGAALRLAFRVSRQSNNACSALAGAQVDVWHCDALGTYSDVADPGFATVGQKFLRGYQLTDAAGFAQFETIYPGWYRGRAVHIHFKIRTSGASSAQEFTSQLYFDDGLTDQVHAQPPYSEKGRRDTRNSGDGIFRSGGSQLVVSAVPEGSGYAATFDVALLA